MTFTLFLGAGAAVLAVLAAAVVVIVLFGRRGE